MSDKDREMVRGLFQTVLTATEQEAALVLAERLTVVKQGHDADRDAYDTTIAQLQDQLAAAAQEHSAEVAALQTLVEEHTTTVRTLSADVVAAAGELVVPLPEPGSDMAKVVIANRLLKRQADEERETRTILRGTIAALVGDEKHPDFPDDGWPGLRACSHEEGNPDGVDCGSCRYEWAKSFVPFVETAFDASCDGCDLDGGDVHTRLLEAGLLVQHTVTAEDLQDPGCWDGVEEGDLVFDLVWRRVGAEDWTRAECRERTGG